MITLWPSAGDIWLATRRAITSTGPPAGVGTMMCTVRLGYLSCAAAPRHPSRAVGGMAAASRARFRVAIFAFSFQLVAALSGPFQTLRLERSRLKAGTSVTHTDP